MEEVCQEKVGVDGWHNKAQACYQSRAERDQDEWRVKLRKQSFLRLKSNIFM